MNSVKTCLVGAVLLAGSAVADSSLEGNFQASFYVYGSPTSSPSVAYSVPAGKNLSYFTGNEVPDDVDLAGRGRIFAGVSFEYYANYALDDGLVFRMYERGNGNEPGDLIYSLALDVLKEGAVVSISFAYNAANVVPDRFFYSVQVAGTGAGKVAGLIVPDRDASVGDSKDQAWEKVNGEWEKLELSERAPKVRYERHGKRNKFGVNHRPRSRVRVETVGHLNETWRMVTELETDDNGDVEYETPEEEEDDQKFYRMVAD